jgi:hypothetical protein
MFNQRFAYSPVFFNVPNSEDRARSVASVHAYAAIPKTICLVNTTKDNQLTQLYAAHSSRNRIPLTLLGNHASSAWIHKFITLYVDAAADNKKLDLLLLQELCAQANIPLAPASLKQLVNSSALAPIDHNDLSALMNNRRVEDFLVTRRLALLELLTLQLHHTLTINPSLFESLMPCYHLNLSTANHYSLLQVAPDSTFWRLFNYLTAITDTPTTEDNGFASLLKRFYATIPAAEATTKRCWFCLFFLRAMEQQNQLTAAHTLLPTQAKACHQLLTRWLDTLAHFLEKTNCDNGRHSFLVSQAKRLVTMLSPGLTSVQTQALLDECERINDRRREREEAAARRAEELQQQQRQDAEARYHAVSTMFYYG